MFLYDIMGTVESRLICHALDQYTPDILDDLCHKNDQMHEALNSGNLLKYDELHYQFHDVFPQLAPNLFLERILTPIKNRLWDFPRRNFVKKWYEDAVQEHYNLISAIKNNDINSIETIWKTIHWGFEYNKQSIIKEYYLELLK